MFGNLTQITDLRGLIHTIHLKILLPFYLRNLPRAIYHTNDLARLDLEADPFPIFGEFGVHLLPPLKDILTKMGEYQPATG